jgi:hypothetical protein
MGAVQQSGIITPGHLPVWVAPGVIGDGGAALAAQRVLASLRGTNFNTTADQPIAIPQRVVAFALTGIYVTNASLSLTTAVGGFYPQAAKAGTPIVAASQVYSALNTGDKLLQATLAAFGSGTRFSSNNLGTIGGLLQVWFSLTTPQSAAATADCYLVGIDLS